ncbi:hypothetical protein H072_1964 [Dactylellina haptotyla CBS 200.50]|uniref:Elongin-A n=1 Tax=Dactylellina haptotyla (strain CBS 200.50) TaxID=1284197 RepID=S8AT03_DACHA|nr:hypothetical protein H072_1964 [Dactylellina haptotyla CBS 200.50]
MYQLEGDSFPTLFELAKRACIRNVDAIDDVGDLPYSIVRPILQKLENPKKLETIQENCPHIASETAELWRVFIRRDFGEEALERCHPKDSRRWNILYRKLQREQEVKDHADIEKLKEDMKKLNDKRRKRQAGFCGVRSEDVAKLRSLDRGFSGMGRASGSWSTMPSGSGGGSRWGSTTTSSGPFKNGTLNRVIMKGRRK